MKAALVPASVYVNDLKGWLPKEAFAPAPRKLWLLLLHVLILFCGYWIQGRTSSTPAHLSLTLVMGHSLACIAFLSHELSHNTIVRNRSLRHFLEVYCWAVNLIPATVWKRVHNQTHHAHANTRADPDRQFLESERSVWSQWYSRIFYPHRHTVRWNPLVAFHFVPYILRNTVAAFYISPAKPCLVPSAPAYTLKQRLAVAGEVTLIVILQWTTFKAVGSRWTAYFWSCPAAILVASSVVMAYVFTNHFLNPIEPIADPLATTTSVVVAPFFNRLHFNFSFHTEHHLFPQMNSDFYPLVSQLLSEQHAGKYNRVPFCQAWQMLWGGEEYAAGSDPVSPHQERRLKDPETWQFNNDLKSRDGQPRN